MKPILISLFVILAISLGYFGLANKPIQAPLNISNLVFTYDGDTFSLKEKTSASGISVYEYTAGATSTMRAYTYVPSEAATRAKGTLNGKSEEAFILWRSSGANIIEPILFVFVEEGHVWKEAAYAKLPPDGGRTTVDRLAFENDSIVLDVKTSGPERNYHETYVPKHYVYKLNGNGLEIQ